VQSPRHGDTITSHKLLATKVNEIWNWCDLSKDGVLSSRDGRRWIRHTRSRRFGSFSALGLVMGTDERTSMSSALLDGHRKGHVTIGPSKTQFCLFLMGCVRAPRAMARDLPATVERDDSSVATSAHEKAEVLHSAAAAALPELIYGRSQAAGAAATAAAADDDASTPAAGSAAADSDTAAFDLADLPEVTIQHVDAFWELVSEQQRQLLATQASGSSGGSGSAGSGRSSPVAADDDAVAAAAAGPEGAVETPEPARRKRAAAREKEFDDDDDDDGEEEGRRGAPEEGLGGEPEPEPVPEPEPDSASFDVEGQSSHSERRWRRRRQAASGGVGAEVVSAAVHSDVTAAAMEMVRPSSAS
jgi:hypothetical protein